jgi:threonine/homoserine/homoserine lactone efflux protein
VSRRAGVLTGLGLAAASCTWTVLALAGLGLLVACAGWVYTAVQLAGAACLIWIGAKMVLGARQPPPVPSAKPGAAGSAAAWKGFLVSMTNPKSVAFYGSIFAVIVPAHAPSWVHVAIVIMLFSNGAVRRTFARGKSVIEAAMGLFLMGLGCRMLVTR